MGRIRFGIKSVYYAIATDDGNGNLTYATPVALAGAKSISLDAQAEALDEYADNGLWFHTESNNGYTGTLVVEDTAACETFLTAVLGRTTGADGEIIEKSTDTQKQFALLWQFELAGATETAKRGKLFRCMAGRPQIASETKGTGITVQTISIPLTALPRISDSSVQASCISTDNAYANWFSAVV